MLIIEASEKCISRRERLEEGKSWRIRDGDGTVVQGSSAPTFAAGSSLD